MIDAAQWHCIYGTYGLLSFMHYVFIILILCMDDFCWKFLSIIEPKEYLLDGQKEHVEGCQCSTILEWRV